MEAMMGEKVLFQKTKGKEVVFSDSHAERVRENIRTSLARQKARVKEIARRLNMNICIETEEKCLCGGVLIYKSSKKFIPTGLPMFGGPTSGYVKETVATTCKECGLKYDDTHKRFLATHDQIKKMRLPPSEDWEPIDKKGEGS